MKKQTTIFLALLSGACALEENPRVVESQRQAYAITPQEIEACRVAAPDQVIWVEPYRGQGGPHAPHRFSQNSGYYYGVQEASDHPGCPYFIVDVNLTKCSGQKPNCVAGKNGALAGRVGVSGWDVPGSLDRDVGGLPETGMAGPDCETTFTDFIFYTSDDTDDPDDLVEWKHEQRSGCTGGHVGDIYTPAGLHEDRRYRVAVRREQRGAGQNVAVFVSEPPVL